MARVVVTARVDAAADVKVDVAQVVQLVQVLVALGDGAGCGDGAGIGQRAVVAAGAGDHVGQQANVGLGHAQRLGFAPQGVQLVQAHPGQQQVLGVRHAGLASRVFFDQGGSGIELLGGGVTWGVARSLEGQRHSAQLGVAVRTHIARQPAGEGG